MRYNNILLIILLCCLSFTPLIHGDNNTEQDFCPAPLQEQRAISNTTQVDENGLSDDYVNTNAACPLISYEEPILTDIYHTDNNTPPDETKTPARITNYLNKLIRTIPTFDGLILDCISDGTVRTFILPYLGETINILEALNTKHTSFTRDIGKLGLIPIKMALNTSYDQSGRLYDISDVLSQTIKAGLKTMAFIVYIYTPHENILYATSVFADILSQTLTETGKAWRQEGLNESFISYLKSNVSFSDCTASNLGKTISSDKAGNLISYLGITNFIKQTTSSAIDLAITPIILCLANNFPRLQPITTPLILMFRETISSGLKSVILVTVTKISTTIGVDASRIDPTTTFTIMGAMAISMYAPVKVAAVVFSPYVSIPIIIGVIGYEGYQYL